MKNTKKAATLPVKFSFRPFNNNKLNQNNNKIKMKTKEVPFPVKSSLNLVNYNILKHKKKNRSKRKTKGVSFPVKFCHNTIISNKFGKQKTRGKIISNPPIYSTNNGGFLGLGEDAVMCEILTRLRVKSLIRLSSVCKRWDSIIHKDHDFAISHLRRSKLQNPSLFIIAQSPPIPRSRGRFNETHDYFLLRADFVENGKGALIHSVNHFSSNCIKGATQPVNGLTCFIHTSHDAVHFYNITTQEKSPWIVSKFLTEEQRTNQLAKIEKLEKEVEKLNAAISAIRKNEEELKSKAIEMNKNYTEALEKLELLKMELDASAKEKRENEETHELLKDEKDLISRKLKEALEKLNDQTSELEKIGEEKAKLELKKINCEFEIFGLQEELSNLKVVSSKQDESLKTQMEKNDKLESQVKKFKCDYEIICTKKNEIEVEVDLMKKEEKSLKQKVHELEKGLEKITKELKQKEKVISSMSAEMKEKDSKLKLLMEEKSSLQKELVEAEKGHKKLISKTKLAETNSEKALIVLKDAAKIFHGSEDENGMVNRDIDTTRVEKEIQPFVSELDSIKMAFKKKEKKIEEMNNQIELLNKSVVDAKKHKNIWTWISSATTIFAAASAAYAARGRFGSKKL